MADTSRGGKVTACNESCGCPSPCPGGTDCRCSSSGADMEHKQCSCGEHCGCNPCTCAKETAATTKGCRCGPACTCATCAAA